MSRYCLLCCVAFWACPVGVRADDPLFSGPQVGEKLPPFKAKGVFGELADKEFDLVAKAEKKPVALVFVHGRTRPAFALTNSVMKYSANRWKDGLETAVIFLTDDSSATGEWMQRVKQHLPEAVTHGISVDGVEGPGAYGLNRNVTLTVLVAKDGKVTANFALVQPSLQADGPKIVKAIVDATGGGKVPTIAEIGGGRYTRARPDAARPNAETDPKLATLLRSVINKQASKEQVDKAAAAVEKYVADNERSRRDLGRIANTIVNSGKLGDYGTEAAQAVLRKWEKTYPAPPKRDRPNARPNATNEKLASLLRAVINKQAAAEDVKLAAEAVETYVADNRTAQRELARITNSVVNSGKISNYGTKAAQEVIQRWAKTYGAQRDGAERDGAQPPRK